MQAMKLSINSVLVEMVVRNLPVREAAGKQRSSIP